MFTRIFERVINDEDAASGIAVISCIMVALVTLVIVAIA